MKDMAITEARHELTALPDQLATSHETLTVTRRGKPVLAILPWDEYEALVETLGMCQAQGDRHLAYKSSRLA